MPFSIYSNYNETFKVVLFWNPNGTQMQDAYPWDPYGTLNWTKDHRYTPIQPFVEGMGPLDIKFEYIDVYPWDRYSIRIAFGLNRTFNPTSSEPIQLEHLSSIIRLTPENETEWRINQNLHPLERQYLDQTLRSMGFILDNQSDSRIWNYDNYYILRIDFVRQPWNVIRGIFVFWIPAFFIGALLTIVTLKRKTLKLTHFLTVFIGVGMTTLPFILAARQLLPPRPSIIEIIFYIEMSVSIVLAIWALLQSYRPYLHND